MHICVACAVMRRHNTQYITVKVFLTPEPAQLAVVPESILCWVTPDTLREGFVAFIACPSELLEVHRLVGVDEYICLDEVTCLPLVVPFVFELLYQQ